ncbi:hypothetical protein GIB67_018187, partial [Kingdonia uniflora]
GDLLEAKSYVSDWSLEMLITGLFFYGDATVQLKRNGLQDFQLEHGSTGADVGILGKVHEAAVKYQSNLLTAKQDGYGIFVFTERLPFLVGIRMHKTKGWKPLELKNIIFPTTGLGFNFVAGRMCSKPENAKPLEPDVHSILPSEAFPQPWWRGVGYAAPVILGDTTSKNSGGSQDSGETKSSKSQGDVNSLDEGANVSKERQAVVTTEAGVEDSKILDCNEGSANAVSELSPAPVVVAELGPGQSAGLGSVAVATSIAGHSLNSAVGSVRVIVLKSGPVLEPGSGSQPGSGPGSILGPGLGSVFVTGSGPVLESGPGSDDSHGLENQHLQYVASSIPLAGSENLVRQPQLELIGHSIACAPFPYTDPYYGGLMAAYGPQALVNPNLLGMHQARMPLPLEMTEEPVYVNAKQYRGIIRRRESRAKAELEKKLIKVRKPYLHESRHQHAMRRARGCGGRFLNTKKTERDAASTKSKSGSGSGGAHNSHSTNGNTGKQGTSDEHHSHSNGNNNYQHHQGFQLSTFHPLSGERGDEGDCSVQQRGSISVSQAPHRALAIQ